MKFKELPEGHYFIHKVTDAVYVEKLDTAKSWPQYILITTIQVVHDGRQYLQRDKLLDNMNVEFTTHADMQKERKSYSARLSHITRRLVSKQPLKGKTLELALSLVTCDDPNAGINTDPLFQGIARKLEAGEPLDDYETHLMVDVRLVHERF